jgi:uncharacterized protein (TIGR03000 family)
MVFSPPEVFMSRKLLWFTAVLVASGLWGSAGGQPATRQASNGSATLRVLLPEDDATLLVDNASTKQTGTERVFASPPLDPRYSYSYTLTAKWEPNNYTEVIRTRVVQVRAGVEVEVDLRKPDPKNPDRFLIRFVPTPEEVVEAMCKLGGVGKDDVVFDLGCGDGRIVITAIKEFKAKRGVGVDIDPVLVGLSRENAKKEGVAKKVEFRQGDVLNIKDLSEASVVMMYMGEDVNLRLMPILKKTLKPGSRIVSHDFAMGDWKPDQKIRVIDDDGDDHDLYLWKIGPN